MDLCLGCFGSFILQGLLLIPPYKHTAQAGGVKSYHCFGNTPKAHNNFIFEKKYVQVYNPANKFFVHI